MKLPKKYQGITPGEWKASLPLKGNGFWYVDTETSESGAVCVVYGNIGGSIKDKAVLLADSPRLAAAVVELREALIELSREEYRDDDDQILDRARNRARSAILETEEWAA